MDGEALTVADASFDAAFSIFGVMLFSDWRRGLREQARVVRPGGKACVATWAEPPGGGPFVVMGRRSARSFLISNRLQCPLACSPCAMLAGYRPR